MACFGSGVRKGAKDTLRLPGSVRSTPHFSRATRAFYHDISRLYFMAQRYPMSCIAFTDGKEMVLTSEKTPREVHPGTVHTPEKLFKSLPGDAEPTHESHSVVIPQRIRSTKSTAVLLHAHLALAFRSSLCPSFEK